MAHETLTTIIPGTPAPIYVDLFLIEESGDANARGGTFSNLVITSDSISDGSSVGVLPKPEGSSTGIVWFSVIALFVGILGVAAILLFRRQNQRNAG